MISLTLCELYLSKSKVLLLYQFFLLAGKLVEMGGECERGDCE